jgi:hypothetical protein
MGPLTPEETTSTCARVQAATGWKRRRYAPFLPVDVPRSVRTPREPAAGGAPLNSRRGENVHFPAQSSHPLAARSVGLSRAPAPSLDGSANQPSDFGIVVDARKRSQVRVFWEMLLDSLRRSTIVSLGWESGRFADSARTRTTHGVSRLTLSLNRQTHRVNRQTHRVSRVTHRVSRVTHRVSRMIHRVSRWITVCAGGSPCVPADSPREPDDSPREPMDHRVCRLTHRVSRMIHRVSRWITV